jgi:hypothetical protein
LYTEQTGIPSSIYSQEVEIYNVAENGYSKVDIGSYYNKSRAEKECSAFKYKGYSLKLPSWDDLASLLDMYIDRKQALTKVAWEFVGTDDYNMGFYPNGKFDGSGYGGSGVKLGYYNNGGGFTTPGVPSVTASNIGKVSTLMTSDDGHPVALLDPVTYSGFVAADDAKGFAGVRCVLGNIDAPPDSND